jgi:hypothetical protein
MDKEQLNIHYVKRKNSELFKQFQREDDPAFYNLQNYIPIYNRFFALNETNYNSVNLNHPWFLSSIKQPMGDNKNVYNCTIQNMNTQETKKTSIFLKLAPLLDPFKYLIGKYNNNDPALLAMPKLNSSVEIGSIHPKLLDNNNCAYVDGFFSYLSSLLIQKYNFVNGVDYYGSFLGIKKQFKLNVVDDLEYLCKAEFFIKNKDKLFKVDDYSFIYNTDADKPLAPITIHNNNDLQLSIKSIDEELFEDVFIDTAIVDSTNSNTNTHLTLEDLKENSLDLFDIAHSDIKEGHVNTTTLKSSSTCSSRTSHTSTDSQEENNRNNGSNNENENDDENENGDVNEDGYESKSNSEIDIVSGTGSNSDGTYEEECVYATIPNFPVQVICMENCYSTFDELIMNNDLSQEEWMSALMQIIMILLTYQKAFAFTHNDLHTNNVMFNKTDKKYIYYCYKKIYYKVPTFGRVFKIIDFGRAIYKCNGLTFCSDSFQTGSDAATQYNTEPYFNDKKPRLEPNYSFDLCRLACSIFDYVIEDLDDIEDIEQCEPIVKIIFEWCLDDNGINILYKNNGVERYPDFKLYKMIARCVHNHIPQAQLERPEFKKFTINKNKIPSDQPLVNIDNIPSFSN